MRRAIAELLHKDPGGRPSDARRITELLQPTGTLSDAQRGLQSLRARQAERDLEHGALVAQAQEHYGLQRQARVAFTALWRRISDSATQAVLDATSTQDGDVFALAVGDAELRVHLSGAPAPAGSLLMVAELYIDRAGQSRIVGNLYCVGDSGVPQWRLIQSKDKGTGKSTGDRAEIFHAIWTSGDDIPPKYEAMSREADTEAILKLFASEAADDSSNRPSDHADELETKLDEVDAAEAKDEDRIIAAMGEEISFMTVASAMTVANTLRALAEGEITIRGSLEPRIDIAFSWHDHAADGRFSEPGGTLLTVKAHVNADPGGGTPVIQATWNPADTPEAVIGRINSQLIERDRWNGPKTIDWGQVFRDLRTAIQLAVAYKRRDPDVPWRLHGALYEIHGTDWAITEAGVEYRPTGTVALAEHEFPENRARMTSTDLNGWAPTPPEGADASEWQHVLWRGLWHLPIQHGPVVSQAHLVAEQDHASAADLDALARLIPGDGDRSWVERTAGAAARRMQRDAHQRLDNRPLAGQVQPLPHLRRVLGGHQRGQHVLPRRMLQLGADLVQPDVRALGRGEQLRPGDQAQRPVRGHLLQVPADRRRLLPQRHHIRPALGDRHQVGGVRRGTAARSRASR